MFQGDLLIPVLDARTPVESIAPRIAVAVLVVPEAAPSIPVIVIAGDEFVELTSQRMVSLGLGPTVSPVEEIEKFVQHGELLATRPRAQKNPSRIQTDEPGSGRTRLIPLPRPAQHVRGMATAGPTPMSMERELLPLSASRISNQGRDVN